ncbi:MAG: FHA domain-containing protein [Planctomycetota bacterium]
MLTLIHYDPAATGKPDTFRVPAGAAWVVGRDQGDLALSDTRVSRRHAEFSTQNNVFVIRDLGSSNGTWVNGERVTGIAELEQGDRIQLGRVTLLVGHIEVRDAGRDGDGASAEGVAASADETAGGWPGQSSSLALDPPDEGPGLSPDAAFGPARDHGEEEAAAPAADGASPPRSRRPESPLEGVPPLGVDATAPGPEPDAEPQAEEGEPGAPPLVGLSLDTPPPAHDSVSEGSVEPELDEPDQEEAGDAPANTEPAEVAWAEPFDSQALVRRRSGAGARWAVAAAVLVLVAGGVGFYVLNRPAAGGSSVVARSPATPPRGPQLPLRTGPTEAAADEVELTPALPTDTVRLPDIGDVAAGSGSSGAASDPSPSEPQPEDAFGDSPALALSPLDQPAPAERVTRFPSVAPPEPEEPDDPPVVASASGEEVSEPGLEVEPPGVVVAPPVVTEPAELSSADGVTADAAAGGSTPAVDAGATDASAASVAETRRLVYLIDASGSMVDSMNQGALTWLSRELGRLGDRDEFAVLFFRGDEVIEAPPAGIRPAGGGARVETLAWVAPGSGNIRPGGKSEPLAAVRRALSYGPTEIYLLSDDKFGSRGRRAAGVGADELIDLMGGDPPVVHTVQFFYRGTDDRTLERIAEAFGGRFEFVREPTFDASPGGGIDLFGVSR